MNLKQIIVQITIVFSFFNINAQENQFSRSAIKTGIAVGFNDTNKESGTGPIYSLGYQINFGKKQRIRLNSTIMLGQFSSRNVTDTNDQYYTTTALGININYDLIKYKSTSLLISTGGFINFSKGLIGTGGEFQNPNGSRYFNETYFGANFGLGIRISNSKSRLAYEIKPLNIEIGNKGFAVVYAMFGIDIKLKK